MQKCQIESTNPTFSFLFDIIGGTSADTLVIDNCIGNIPLANLNDYTAINQNINYTFLSYLKTEQYFS